MGIIFLSPSYREQILGEWYDRRDNAERLASQITPQQAGNVEAWARLYGGYADPDIVAGMGLSGVPAGTPAADAFAAMSFEELSRGNPLRGLEGTRVNPRVVEGIVRDAETPAPPEEVPIGDLGLLGQLGRAFGNTVKAVSRGTFLGFSAPFEEASALVTSFAEAALDSDPGFFSDGWRNFTDEAAPSGLRLAIGELADRVTSDGFDPDDLWRDSEEFIGSGLLPGGEIAATRERQRHNLYLPSQAGAPADQRFLTPGRALLGLTTLDRVVEPGTRGYNLLSGIADFAANIFADPVNLVLPGVGAGGRAAATLDDLPTVERTLASLRSMGFRGPRQTVDADGAAYMLRGGSTAVNRTIHRLVEETSPSRILGALEARGARVTLDMADRLARARTPEAIADALINGPDGILASATGLPTISRFTNWRMSRLPHHETTTGLGDITTRRPIYGDVTEEVTEEVRRDFVGIRDAGRWDAPFALKPGDIHSDILRRRDDALSGGVWDALSDEARGALRASRRGATSAERDAGELTLVGLARRDLTAAAEGRGWSVREVGGDLQFRPPPSTTTRTRRVVTGYEDVATPEFARAQPNPNIFDRMGSRVARAFERIPPGILVSADDPETAVRSFRGWLRANPDGFAEDVADDLTDQMIRVDWNSASAQSDADAVIHTALERLQDRSAALGIDQRAWPHIFSTFDEYRNVEARFYQTIGDNASPMPFLGALARDPKTDRYVRLDRANINLAFEGELVTIPTAALETDLHRFGTYLPDLETMKRAVSRYSALVKGANIESGNAARKLAETYFMPLWVGSQVIRPATALRAVGDSMVRLALMGSRMTPAHPIEFVTSLLGAKKERGVTGQLLETYDVFVDDVAGGLSALVDTTGRGIPAETLSDDWGRFGRGHDNWLTAHAQRLAHMANDRLVRKVAGLSHDEAVDWLMSSEGRGYLRPLRHIAAQMTDRQAFSDHVASIRDNIVHHTGGDPDLIHGIADGRVAGVDVITERYGWTEDATSALAGYSDRLPATSFGPRPIRRDGRWDQASTTWKRASAALSHLFSATVVRTEDVMVRSPRFRELYWENVTKLAPRMTAELREQVLESARSYAGRGKGGLLDSRNRDIVARLEAGLKGPAGVDLDDITLVDDYASTLARDTIKGELYDHHSRNNLEAGLRLVAPFLSPQRDTIQQWIKGFSHNPRMIRRAQQGFVGARQADLDGDGRGFFYKTPDGREVFAYPSWLAALGVGTAAGIGTGAGVAGVARFLGQRLPGPAGLAVGAAAGLGAAYLANEELNVPGGQVQFQADVGSLNLMGNDLLPGLGPVVTIPASFIAQRTPQYADFWEVVLPYGREEIESGVVESQLPGYMQRFLTALQVSEEGQRMFGNTAADVLQTMIASGEWTDPGTGLVASQDQPALLEEASTRARGLFFVRGLAAFVLPAAPRFEFLAEDDDGRLTALESLATVYRTLTEQYGRDEAMSQFISLFGADAFASTVASSKSVAERSVDPLGADWERAHPELVERYRQVVGYLAPHQPTGFDHVAYRDQLRTGDRVALSPQQSLWLHNNIVGSAIVRRQVEAMGEAANRVEGRMFLAALRQSIRENFQGYGSADDTLPGRADPAVQITELREAVRDGVDSPMVAPLRRFLYVWDQADALARDLGSPAGIMSTSQSEEMLRLREMVRAEAVVTIQRYPQFSEVWAGVFERALADDSEAPPIPVWGGTPVDVTA